MPPWQHYDEPGHFEYAWLMAQRGIQPEPGDYDMDMRRAVAKSMLDHGFFHDLSFRPDLKSTTQPAWIGDYPQFDNPPFYYSVIALMLRLIPDQGVEEQLYTGRMVSLFFFLLSLLAAWGIAAELCPSDHSLRLLLPLTLALLPGYVDLMTAVNNDSAAVALVSLFLWAGVRLIQRGPAILPLLSMLVTAVLCYWTKDTTYLIYPFILLVLLFAFFRNSRRWLAWTVVIFILTISVPAAIETGDAAGWYRSTSQQMPTRATNSKAVVGSHVFQLEAQAQVTPVWIDPLFQPVPALTGIDLPENTYTLGGWMWASQPVAFATPELGSAGSQVSKVIDLGIEPTFFVISLTVPGGKFQRVWVNLRGVKPAASPYIIYYDGLVLAEGVRPRTAPPVYTDDGGRQGEWGGLPFLNLLRNASAEKSGLRIRPWADDLGARLLPDQVRPSLILTYILDWNGAWWLYRATALRLLRTFLGMFGWGHVPLLGHHPYRYLLAISILGIVGAIVWFLRRLHTRLLPFPWEAFTILAFTFIGYWGVSFVRSPIFMSLPHLYLPVARNAFPAIIPTILLFGTGWFELLRVLRDMVAHQVIKLNYPGQAWVRAAPVLIYCVLFLAWVVYAVWSINSFYRRM
jgi:hypothetical protein